MSDMHLGFIEQALHYFDRTAAGRPAGAIGGPAAWTGDGLRREPTRWIVELTGEQLEDLGRTARSHLDAGRPMGQLAASDFPLPTWATEIDRWRSVLTAGTGVLCLRGLPVREWGEQLSAYAYWGLGHRIGRPGAQNPQGDLLGTVTDDGSEQGQAMARRYRTSGDIRFHCDAADAVGLLCIRTAAQGGESRIASSVAVFDLLAAEQPDLVEELFSPFDIDRRDEQGEGEAPTLAVAPCAWDGTRLRTFWHSDYMRSAERHPTVELSARRRQVIDAFDAIAARPEVHLDMSLTEGDIQLLSNHHVIHARTAYTDRDDPSERRRLLRLWLSIEPNR